MLRTLKIQCAKIKAFLLRIKNYRFLYFENFSNQKAMNSSILKSQLVLNFFWGLLSDIKVSKLK